MEYRFLNPFYICYYSDLIVSSLWNFVAGIILCAISFVSSHFFYSLRLGPFLLLLSSAFVFSVHRLYRCPPFVGEFLLLLFYNFLCIRMYIYSLIRFMCHHNFVMCIFMALCLNYLFYMENLLRDFRQIFASISAIFAFRHSAFFAHIDRSRDFV